VVPRCAKLSVIDMTATCLQSVSVWRRFLVALICALGHHVLCSRNPCCAPEHVVLRSQREFLDSLFETAQEALARPFLKIIEEMQNMQGFRRRAAPVRFSYYDRHTSLHLHPIQRIKLASPELDKEMRMDILSLDSPHSKKNRKTMITIIVPCIKPIVPTPDNLLCLAFLESAFAAELEAQRRRLTQRLPLDSEALALAFTPLLNGVEKMHGIGMDINLSRRRVHSMFPSHKLPAGWNRDNTECLLHEATDNLRRFKEDVRILSFSFSGSGMPFKPEWLGECVHLESLNLDGGGGGDSDDIPTYLGDLCALKHLTLERTQGSLTCILQMTSLTSLKLHECGFTPQQLHTCFEQLTGLKMLHLHSLGIELPSSFWLPANLTQLSLCGCIIPASIGALTRLKSLSIQEDAIMHQPTFSVIQTLTSLQCINLACKSHWPSQPSHTASTIRTLSFLLSAQGLRGLQRIYMSGLSVPAVHIFCGLENSNHTLGIGLSLKAWPLSLLVLEYDIGLRHFWQDLALPAEARYWNDAIILNHSWHSTKHRIEAFASGMHLRLGATSSVSLLNDQILILIADEVLNGVHQGYQLEYEAWLASKQL